MELWKKFSSEDISSLITNKIDNDVYSVYTDYETDYTADYTAILGHQVKSLDNIPTGLVGREFNAGKYFAFKAKGKRPVAVIDKWKEIWGKDKELNRTYIADFEVYGQKSLDPENSEVDIYIATK
jgi:predicted transcriptional regulator YdeE